MLLSLIAYVPVFDHYLTPNFILSLFFFFFSPNAHIRFIAPEVLSDTIYTSKCDIWSLGVLTYVLFSGLMPFSKLNHSKALVS
jgi:serine/threonine protein kinase